VSYSCVFCSSLKYTLHENENEETDLENMIANEKSTSNGLWNGSWENET